MPAASGCHLQAELFALDLPHRLAPLLAVHLLPVALRWMVGCSIVFLPWLGFHAYLLCQIQLGPTRLAKTTQSPQRGRAVLLCRTTPATISIIARTGAMLIFGQERSRENAALAASSQVIFNSVSVFALTALGPKEAEMSTGHPRCGWLCDPETLLEPTSDQTCPL